LKILHGYYLGLFIFLKLIGYIFCGLMVVFGVLNVLAVMGVDLGDANFPAWAILVEIVFFILGYLLTRINPRGVTEFLLKKN